MATTNSNQIATVGTAFTYTVNAFTGTAPITYTASNLPAGLYFDATGRVISGMSTTPATSTVTITGTNSAGISSTSFTITVNPAPAVTDRLTVLSRDPDNGQLNTNTIKPYLLLQNDGSTPIPYGELTVRYYLTVENPAPLRFEINYAQMGNDKIHLNYVPLIPARQGASGYIEFSFDAAAGSLAPMSQAVIQNLINKQDYAYFFQGDDYSYVNNANFAANPHITAYRNGRLIYGAEPPAGVRRAADGADASWTVQILGNPVAGSVVVEITGAEGEHVDVSLVNELGHVVNRRSVVPTVASHQEMFDVSGQGAGLLLLRVESATHQQTLKVLKR